MSDGGSTAHTPRPAPVRITAGGVPSPRRLAALTAALTTLVESSEVPLNVKDVGPPWGVH